MGNKFKSELMKLRAIAGLTQKELAEHLGISHKTVSRWETGEREALLTPKQWKTLQKVLNVTADQIPDHFGPTPSPEGSK